MKKALSTSSRWAYAICLMAGNLVYMMTAQFVLNYYNVYLGLSAGFVGTILMVARIFDAVNDPLSGVIVAKCHFKGGRFRPWLISGSIINGMILFGLFAVPQSVYAADDKTMLMWWCGAAYLLWSITYDMFDIPIWSVIPAVAHDAKSRDSMAAMGRTAATVGCGIVTILGIEIIKLLGGGSSYDKMIDGFKWFALAIYVVYVLASLVFCRKIKGLDVNEEAEDGSDPSIGEMFRALFKNNQALVVVLVTALILFSTYVTSNFILYFFQFDIGKGSEDWSDSYTLFNTALSAFGLLSTMAVYPLLRKFMSRKGIFYLSVISYIAGYAILCVFAIMGVSSVWLYMIPCILIGIPFGLVNVLQTVLFADTVDYGEYQSGHRDESVIQSLQTLVVKAASGFAAGLAGWILVWIGLDTTEGALNSTQTLMSMRMVMACVPIAGIIIAAIIFGAKYILDEKKMNEISAELESRHSSADDEPETTEQ